MKAELWNVRDLKEQLPTTVGLFNYQSLGNILDFRLTSPIIPPTIRHELT